MRFTFNTSSADWESFAFNTSTTDNDWKLRAIMKDADITNQARWKMFLQMELPVAAALNGCKVKTEYDFNARETRIYVKRGIA